MAWLTYNEAVGSRTHLRTVKFDRPTVTNLHITLTATRKNATESLDLDLIKQSIAKREFIIGESCQAADLYYYAYQAGSNYVLTDMQVSDDDLTFTDEEIAANYDAKLVIDTDNISITEVIPWVN